MPSLYTAVSRRTGVGPALPSIRRLTSNFGERFHIYASRRWAAGKLFLEGCRVRPDNRSQTSEGGIRGDNIGAAGGGPEAWMLELAGMLILNDLPVGVIVGSAVVERVTERAGGEGVLYEWHLGGVERARRLRRPQPVWFNPF